MDEWIERGPLPLPSTINAELEEVQESLMGYLRVTRLATKSLVPMAIHLHVGDGRGDNLPAMFARLTEAKTGPLYPAEKGNPNWEKKGRGLLCILPAPLQMGIRAVAIQQSNFDGMQWHLDRVEFLAPDPTLVPELMEPDRPRDSIHPFSDSYVLRDIPNLSPDAATQRLFEASIHDAAESIPESYDEREELLPGISTIWINDGHSMGDLDELTAYSFVEAALSGGASESIGKGVFGRITRHIANTQLEIAARSLNTEELTELTRTASRKIDQVTSRSGTDILFGHKYNHSSFELLLDYDTVRDVAIQLIRGELVIAGIAKSGLATLRTMFDQS